jgi:hypothetical protein
MPLLAGKILQFGFVAYVLAILLFLLGLAAWVDPLGLLTPTSPLTRWLDACPENDVRFACNLGHPSHYALYGHIDFDQGHLGVEADPDDFGATTPTRTPRSIYSIPINPAQTAEIAHVIEIMPEQKMTFLQSYDFDHDIYFSLWKDHQLQIYGYAKNALPQEVSGLLKSFRVNLNDAIN